MKHTTKPFLSSLLCVALYTIAGAQVPGNVLPAVERAATQAAQRAAAQTARIAVPQVTNAAAQTTRAVVTQVPRVATVVPTDLLTFSTMDKALQVSAQRTLTWQNMGLLPKNKTLALGTALATNKNLQTAHKFTPDNHVTNLQIIEENMEWYPLARQPIYSSLRMQDLYPKETAQGLFSSREDFLNYLMYNNNRFYTYVAAKHVPALRRNIATHLEEFRREARNMPQPKVWEEFVWAAQQVPVDTDTLFWGEEHTQWIPEQMIPMIDVLQERMKGREIIFLTEFLPKGHVLNLEKDGSSLRSFQMELVPLWSALEEKNISVIGLEPVFKAGTIEQKGTRCEFYVNETCPKGRFSQSSKRSTQNVWDTLEGMRIRNQQWLEEIQRQRAAHPDALFIIHAGFAHTSYLYPFAIVHEIPGKNFVMEIVEEKSTTDFDDLVYPHEMPNILKWSNPELGRAAGFDLRIKLDEWRGWGR